MTKTTVTAFIFHENKLLLVFHKKLQCWMHVGGHVEKNESLEIALKREIKEETGLSVKIIDSYSSNVIIDESNAIPLLIQENIDDISIDYVCKVIGKSDVILQGSELTEYKWIKESEIDSIDTFPLLKRLAKEAFKIYTKSQEK